MRLYKNTKVYICDKLTTIYPQFKDDEVCKIFPIFVVISGHINGITRIDEDDYIMTIFLDPIKSLPGFDKTPALINHSLSSLNETVFLSNEDAQLKATTLNSSIINSTLPLPLEIEAKNKREYDALSRLRIGDYIKFVKCNGYMTTGKIEKLIVSDKKGSEPSANYEILALVSEIDKKEKGNVNDITLSNGIYLKADHMRDDKLFCCTTIWRYEL